MGNGRFPDFLLIGAAKAGTTSLFHYLQQHPAIFGSATKEPQFFLCGEPDGLTPEPDGTLRPGAGARDVVNVREVVGRVDRYMELFAGAAATQWAGEASPPYLYDPQAPRRIAARIPNVRLLAILRNPVDRAFSHYQRSFELGTEPMLSFEDAIGLEDIGAPDYYAGQRHYLRMGFYFRQISRFLEWFPPDRLHVCFLEDLNRDPDQVVRHALEFLGVRADVALDVRTHHNTTTVPSHRRLHRFLSQRHPMKEALKAWLPPRLVESGRILTTSMRSATVATTPPALSVATRRRVTALYEADIAGLERLLDRDLAGWRR